MRTLTKQPHSENRVVMLTDVEDSSFQNEKLYMEGMAGEGIHATIIGISDSFRSDLCENLTTVKGFNYFCATETPDLRKYLFENFDFTFFPSANDIVIRVASPQIASFEVFGSSDSDKVRDYNGSFEAKGPYTITRTTTSFPSELEVSMDGNVKMSGGLILIKLKLKEPAARFEGLVSLEYKNVTAAGETPMADEYPICFDGPEQEQYYS